jgi:predicted PurR-regulated permease PerM
MTTVIILTCVMFLFLLIIVYINQSNKQNKQIQEEQEHHRENNLLDTTVNLTKLEQQILDKYEQSNIKLPIDIIEDLSSMNLRTDYDIINFIEVQRRYWKLECQKKLFQLK